MTQDLGREDATSANDTLWQLHLAAAPDEAGRAPERRLKIILRWGKDSEGPQKQGRLSPGAAPSKQLAKQSRPTRTQQEQTSENHSGKTADCRLPAPSRKEIRVHWGAHGKCYQKKKKKIRKIKRRKSKESGNYLIPSEAGFWSRTSLKRINQLEDIGCKLIFKLEIIIYIFLLFCLIRNYIVCISFILFNTKI